ncbi:hypothetical protein [Simkania sp.]|uniref:hypothetical protein n=1 Tax=Simkania sp. TaxID=34094 RepID=UPI003B525677
MALLGDFEFQSKTFPDLEQVIKGFHEKSFLELNVLEKSDTINRALYNLIQKEEGPTFLLGAVVDYISRIKKEAVIESYNFASFELWLNQFSGLSAEENYRVRAKIAGKWVPRDTYQIYFPIGMGKRYRGTHFVTAHMSPDLDTTVASFWGWIDSFAARVSEGLHVWNVPGGPPYTQVEITLLFKDLFGSEVFNCVAKTRLSLTVTSIDLMTQTGLSKRGTQNLALNFDHERTRNAVVVVDDQGYYLGDWRSIDVEGVRQIVMSLNNCLMWLESNLHIHLISCFAKTDLSVNHISKVIRDILNVKIGECEPAKELPQKQLQFVHDYLVKVLHVDKGTEATFEDFALSMEKMGIVNFTEIITWLKSLIESDLFDASGKLTENRPRIFNQLEVLVKMLAEAFHSIRRFVDRLEIAFKIKTDVFGFVPQYLSHRTDVEEIRSKIGNYTYLTVNRTDIDGRLVPIGLVQAADLQKEPLGTVTLRDFCNREEMNIPSYLEVISVIDHHKSTLNTDMPPRAIISDAQSSNAIVAQMAFQINDMYGTGGMTLEQIEAQLKELEKDLSSAVNIRKVQRLLQHKKVVQSDCHHYVDPKREFAEYLHFVYAILDDTDLLTKVSRVDVEIMASLLNRLKSLIEQKEMEIVDFDDIKEDHDFTKKAASRLLQNKDFYSLYSKVYLHKEQSVGENLEDCAKGLKSNIFSDTKILNMCNRVSQTKIFARNYTTFETHAPELRRIWYQNAQASYENNHELLLHLHMVSTVTSADDLFKGKEISYWHQDELWIWIPPVDGALEKLKLFLSSFKSSPKIQAIGNWNVEFLGENAKELSQVFKESFLKAPHKMPDPKASKEALPIAILRFDAGRLNSRKGLIAPFLPKLSQ